jgi:hypothetical protein
VQMAAFFIETHPAGSVERRECELRYEERCPWERCPYGARYGLRRR